MRPNPDSIRTFAGRHGRRLASLLCFAVAVFCSVATAAVESTGTLSGLVSNAATGNLLQGARIEVPQLGLSALLIGSWILRGLGREGVS